MTQQPAVIEKVSTFAFNTSEVTFVTPKPFLFIAGQYVTITLPILKQLPIKEQFHDFSIASSPEDTGHIRIAIRNSDSAFKKVLLQGDKQTEVLLEGPKGIFTLPDDPTIPVVFIVGGIGITPFLSMIRHVMLSKLPYKITLFYYNHSPETTAYFHELEGYGNAIRFIPIFTRIAEKDIVSYLQVLQTDTGEGTWYIAGPRGMVKTAREILTKLHVDERYIKSEEFSGYE